MGEARHGRSPEKKHVAAHADTHTAARIAAAICCILFAAGGVLLWTLMSGQISHTSPVTATETTVAPVATDPVTTAPPTTTTTVSPASVNHYRQQRVEEWSLLLVNKWNLLPEGYEEDTVYVEYDEQGNRIDERVRQPLMELLSAGSQYHLWGALLYRDGETQQAYFDAEVARQKALGFSDSEAQVMAASEVIRPGTSEHQTGLAIDVLGGDFTDRDPAFADSDAGKWLAAHCAEYGFILRYPKGKEAITGMEYEPWHIRYVGEEYAKEIMSRGLTLEEFLEEKGW